MLDLRRLGVLREVAAAGSFSAAAENLSFTPSAVSQQMSILERDAGAPLFERTARGVHLTEAGRVLLAHAEAVLLRLDEAQADLKALADGRAGTVRLGSFPTATASFVADAMERFRRRHEAIELHLADGEPYESVARLRARELDLAVVFDFERWSAATDYDGRSVADEGALEYVDLLEDRFLLVLPADHPLRAREVVGLRDLVGERIVGSPALCSPWGTDLQHACREAGFEPSFEAHYRCADFSAVQAIVATGRGVSLLPRLACAGLRADVVVRELERAPVRQVRIASLAQAARSPAGTAMVELLRECAAGLRRADLAVA